MLDKLGGNEVVNKIIPAVLFWTASGAIVYFLPPRSDLVFGLFFGCIFLAVLYTGSLVFSSRRLGLVTALFVIAFLLLCFYGFRGWLYLGLLTALFLTLMALWR